MKSLLYLGVVNSQASLQASEMEESSNLQDIFVIYMEDLVNPVSLVSMTFFDVNGIKNVVSASC